MSESLADYLLERLANGAGGRVRPRVPPLPPHITIEQARSFAKGKLHEILHAAEAQEAQDILTIDRYAHLVGSCAMSDSPERGVIDSDHRAWGVPNLFIADGSVMPTQGSANPALTIMALASRLAERLHRKRIDPSVSQRPARGHA